MNRVSKPIISICYSIRLLKGGMLMNLNIINLFRKPKEYSEEIKKQVKKIMEIEITDEPAYNLISYFLRVYPQAAHELLGFPGEFVRILDSAVIIYGKEKLYMDYVEKTNLKNEIFDWGCVILKYKSGKLTSKDLEELLIGYIYNIRFNENPCYIYVLTDEKRSSYKNIEINGFVFRINFISYDRKKINKSLKTLSKKDFKKDEFSEIELLNFLFSIIFAKSKYSIKILNKSIDIFNQMDNIDLKYRRDIYRTLIIMIKYHCRDNKKITKELLSRIVEIYN